MMYAPDLDIELGRIRYSQDALLKRRPQGEKSYVQSTEYHPGYHLITLTLITRTVIANSLLPRGGNNGGPAREAAERLNAA